MPIIKDGFQNIFLEISATMFCKHSPVLTMFKCVFCPCLTHLIFACLIIQFGQIVGQQSTNMTILT